MAKINELVEVIYNVYQPSAIDIADMKQECYLATLVSDSNRSIKDIVERACRQMIMRSGYSVPIICTIEEFKDMTLEHIHDTYEAISLDDKDVLAYYDMDKKLIWDNLHMLIGTLKEKEQLVIQERFFDGYSLYEVGQHIGITQMRVLHIEKDALNKLRKPHRIRLIEE